MRLTNESTRQLAGWLQPPTITKQFPVIVLEAEVCSKTMFKFCIMASGNLIFLCIIACLHFESNFFTWFAAPALTTYFLSFFILIFLTCLIPQLWCAKLSCCEKRDPKQFLVVYSLVSTSLGYVIMEIDIKEIHNRLQGKLSPE